MLNFAEEEKANNIAGFSTIKTTNSDVQSRMELWDKNLIDMFEWTGSNGLREMQNHDLVRLNCIQNKIV